MLTFHNFLLGIVLLMILFLAAYSLGKQAGKRQGITLGRAETNLLLRAQALRENRCPICNRHDFPV